MRVGDQGQCWRAAGVGVQHARQSHDHPQRNHACLCLAPWGHQQAGRQAEHGALLPARQYGTQHSTRCMCCPVCTVPRLTLYCVRIACGSLCAARSSLSRCEGTPGSAATACLSSALRFSPAA